MKERPAAPLWLVILVYSLTLTIPLLRAYAEDNWPTHGGTYDEQRYSPLQAINANNVSRLHLAWYYDLDTSRGQESTPLEVDGTLYATTAWSKVVALDAATGKRRWTYDPHVPGATGLKACCDVVNRGAAYEDGRIFFGSLDGRLIALDAKTGHEIWSVVTVDQNKSYTITGAPRVVRGKVFIGNGGAEYGLRGYVSAYSAKTGKLLWRFYTVPGDPAAGPDHAASDDVLEKARSSWFGEYWKYGAGGTVWDSIVYDAALNQLYIGVGNGSPWNRRIRSEDKGDNLFLSSIVALNPDTGKYLWHYQETPGESWDFTASQQITLAIIDVEGQSRDVILHAPKNGFFYVIDRHSGALLSAEKFAPVNWASGIDKVTGRPIETENARFKKGPFLAASGASGAHNWQSMAYSPVTGLVYIPAQLIPFLYLDDSKFKFEKGLWNIGVDLSSPLPSAPSDQAAMMKGQTGWLLAWNPVTQKEAWRVDHGGPWNGGVLATAGDLVFQGTADKRFHAYRARDGQELWKFPTQTAVIAAPIAYRVAGEEYVSVLAGNGGGVALAMPYFSGPDSSPNGRILAFKLDGTASLPRFTSAVAPPVVPTETWSDATIEQGRKRYSRICSGCHGFGAYSAGVLPDLRRSPVLLSKDAWNRVVIHGALQNAGMVSFKDYLDDAAAEDIRGYVSSEASKLKAH
jgi:quinohemoprotein ethanol dehydrogenase